MENVPGLVEYLQAVQKPGGDKLIQMGSFQVIIDGFPPGTTISFNITPFFGEYCSVSIMHRFSPDMVPGAFSIDVSHKGLHLEFGNLDSQLKLPLFGWMEITEASPLVSSYTNISGVSQYMASIDDFIIINNEADYKEVMRLVRVWGNFEPPGGG